MTRLTFLKSIAALLISGTLAGQLGAKKPVVVPFDPVAYVGEFRFVFMSRTKPLDEWFGYAVLHKRQP